MDEQPETEILSIDVHEPDLLISGHLLVGAGHGMLVMRGSLCTHLSRLVAEDLRRWIDAAGGATISFDLAGLDFIDARGLSLLIELQHHASTGGGSISAVAMSPGVARLFQLCGLEVLIRSSHLVRP